MIGKNSLKDRWAFNYVRQNVCSLYKLKSERV
nr:MAG TPA: hypothetical protein [Caudoviricetes sp.]